VIYRMIVDEVIDGVREQRAIEFYERSGDAYRAFLLLHRFARKEIDVRLERESSSGADGWFRVSPLGK
jgi:hypothetical protein